MLIWLSTRENLTERIIAKVCEDERMFITLSLKNDGINVYRLWFRYGLNVKEKRKSHNFTKIKLEVGMKNQ